VEHHLLLISIIKDWKGVVNAFLWGGAQNAATRRLAKGSMNFSGKMRILS
jgi:hypothetical protein